MTYYLGVDLGTTFTSASTWRDGKIEIKNLGSHTAAVPSVVLLREDATILTGEAANRRAMTEPHRVAREFKRRLGDTTPIVVGGSPYSAEALMARLLESVTDEVAQREGGPPAGIAITHPANWGEYKRDLLRQAVRLADLPDVTLLSEPEAAAIHYANENRVEVGQIVAVFDLGGGTFDAAVLRKTTDSFEILGRPEGIERLGGIDFDAAVFAHVARALGGSLEDLDEDDPTAVAAVARLRSECVDAKEALSSDTDTTIPALLPNVQTEVRITRNEFETMIRPALADSMGAMRRALDSAGVDAEEISAVLLVGGSSRIPLVAQLVGSELGRPVAVDTHPKHAVALGAAVAAAQTGGAIAGETVDPAPPAQAAAVAPVTTASTDHTPPPRSAPEPAEPPVDPVVETAASEPTIAVAAVDATVAVPAVDPEHGLRPDPNRVGPSGPADTPTANDDGGRRKGILLGVGALLLVAIVAIAAVALSGGDENPDSVAATDDPAGDDTVPDEVAVDEPDDGVVAAVDPTPTATPEPEPTPEPTPTPTPPPDEVCNRDQEMWVCLTSVNVVDGLVQATYDSQGFVPDIGGGIHYHFYGNVRDETNAGSQGTNNPDWLVWDQPTFSVDFATVDLSLDQSDKLCVVLGSATVGHQAILGTGNCLPLL